MKKIWLLSIFLSAFTLFAAPKRGAVCFTFDDYHGKNWLKADAIFKKYNAHATFFIVKEITPEKAEVMKQLRAAGHSVGLHTVHHRNATNFIQKYGEDWYFRNEIKPQLDRCKEYGIKVASFAYPNNRRDERSDKLLFRYFDFLRAGQGPARKPIYYPIAGLKPKMVLGGGGIGVYYNSKLEELVKILEHAAATDSMVVFFSHNIAPRIGGISMPSELLDALLKRATELNMSVIGFDEVPGLAAGRK